ncbi:MAG: hypothetical protein H8E24_07815 [Verrucomicrobia bacterium]|nr:hypothetical protein [Verrucomicrobiota bacterium]
MKTRNNIDRFEYSFPPQTLQQLKFLANEQYDPSFLTAVRPIIYGILPFHEIKPEFLSIHDNCLIYVRALIGMEQFNEAFTLLYKLNLKRLDDFEYREFSDAALELAGKMIAANPKSANHVRTLLAKINIRNNGADHEAYLKLCDSLRRNKLYPNAIEAYVRLGANLQNASNSPLKGIVAIWPIYCHLKMYELYAPHAASNPQYAAAASLSFNTAAQGLKKLDENPPKRQTNEYSLYKLLRALLRIQYAKRYEAQGSKEQAAEYYRQSVLEVTEGIVMARVGLDWLPESLLMAGGAYEKLNLNEAARNVYRQVGIFYKDSSWAAESKKRIAALPPS